MPVVAAEDTAAFGSAYLFAPGLEARIFSWASFQTSSVTSFGEFWEPSNMRLS